MRALFIYLSQAGWARRLITGWRFAWNTASRFVAGESLEEAIEVVKSLNAKGIWVTIDHLGEHTSSEKDAESATEAILEIINAITNESLVSGVSIKLTQIGLELDADLCARNLIRIVTRANEEGIFIRIDMEDSPWVDKTLDLGFHLRRDLKFDNVGVVIQSYLYRSEEDIRRLCEDRTPVRICKGAYKEPPEIAYPRKKDVDLNFDRITERLIDCTLAGPRSGSNQRGMYPPIAAIATHDEKRIDHAKAYAAKIGLPKADLEFQMLYGIRRDLQLSLVEEGYPVRVYVAYGSEWYPFFMRRLAERPANVLFFLSNFFRN